MKAILVDRLGFERIFDDAAGNKIIVPRRFVPGQSEFHRYGPAVRDGKDVYEYREVDDMSEEMKKAHSMADYLRSEIRQLQGTIRSLQEENGAMALELRRAGQTGSADRDK